MSIALQVLQQYFGFNAFRAGQIEIIEAILAKQNVLVVLPTGGGKSLCFQVPALIFPGVTLVISPLISLMKDQVDHLLAKGIAATYLASNLTQAEQSTRLTRIVQGKIKLCYVSPEKLEQMRFVRLCQQLPISMLVIDEAHCISLWGSKFRPSYQKIPQFIEKIKQENKKIVLAAFTATANHDVVQDIKKHLQLNKVRFFQQGFLRENLFWQNLICSSTFDKNILLFKIIKQHVSQAIIIYCSTRIACEQLFRLIRTYDFHKRYPCTIYHGGLEQSVREQAQNDFLADRKPIMIATNAFGMGVDKSNVRVVVHYQIPAHLENYYQEAGRAGRDGNIAHAYLLYQDTDLLIQQKMISNTHLNQNHPRYHIEINKLKQIQRYATSDACLEQQINTYFGGKNHPGFCQHCSICLQQQLSLTQTERDFVSDLEKINHRFTSRQQLDHPPVLFTIKQIELMAILEPRTLADLRKIPGVGNAIIDAYANSRSDQRISSNC